MGLTTLKINQIHNLDSRRSLPSTAIGGENDGEVFRLFELIHNL